jgi:peptidoglycan/LPS O-acetylase OafA/YrhL
METLHLTRPAAGLGFARVVAAIAGIIHLTTSLLLLLAPYSYFMLLEHFPPYNRHYFGDLGAFQLPLGIGLLLAAREPSRYRVVVLMAAAANLLHALNHIYEGLISPTTFVYWIADVGPLLLMSVVLMVAYLRPAQPE